MTFSIASANPVPYAAIPTIQFGLRVVSPIDVRSVALRCQIMIEPARRLYREEECEGLRDLFGDPDRWSRTLRPMLWTCASTTIHGFTGDTIAALDVPCTFDFNVGASKYFHALQDGDLPLRFQFSGTIFYNTPQGALQIDQIDWGEEAEFRLPVRVWKEMMDQYYPNSAWLRLNRDAFERLYAYKRLQGLATWEEAIESLLPFRMGAVS
jgi:hypothetical protein